MVDHAGGDSGMGGDGSPVVFGDGRMVDEARRDAGISGVRSMRSIASRSDEAAWPERLR
jgi:hypothetical protein